MLMPLNSSVINSRWCYPAAQHLTTSAGGGGKGIPSSPGLKKKVQIIEGALYLHDSSTCLSIVHHSWTIMKVTLFM